jgi:hypothetical protein
MRSRRIVAVLLGLSSTLVLTGVPAARAATAPYCGITWGSLAKSTPEMTGAPIVGARVGRHDCWDRLVIDLSGMPAPGYYVRYTDVFRDVGGNQRWVSGGAILTVTVRAPAYNSNGVTVPWTAGQHIVSPSQFTAGGFRTFRDLVYGGTYEGQTQFGLGVRARLPFRVFKLDGPGGGSRLVVDVAHQW